MDSVGDHLGARGVYRRMRLRGAEGDPVRNRQRFVTSFEELGAVAEPSSHQFWNSVASRSSAPELLLKGNGIFDDAPEVISDLNGDGAIDEKDLKLLRVASNIKKVKFLINGNLRSRAGRGKSPGSTGPPACATGTRVDSLPIPGRHPTRSREGCPNQPRIGNQWSVQSILHTSSFPVGRLRDRSWETS